MGLLKGVWLLRTHPVQMCGLIPCKVPAGAGLPSLAPFTFYQVRIQKEGLRHMPAPWSWTCQDSETPRPRGEWIQGNEFLSFINYCVGLSGSAAGNELRKLYFTFWIKRQEVKHAFEFNCMCISSPWKHAPEISVSGGLRQMPRGWGWGMNPGVPCCILFLCTALEFRAMQMCSCSRK